MLHTTTVLDDTLTLDVAILSTLAHLHCATIAQLHALCFPAQSLATARLTLHYLADAHFVARSTWRLQPGSRARGQGGCCERGQVWTLAARGSDLLQRYATHVPPLARIDLARPSTALEHEEWRVRLDARTLVTRLLLEARTTAVFHHVAVQFPWTMRWPTAWGHAPQPDPDLIVSVVWQPAAQHPADWLPWPAVEQVPGAAIHYPIYLERTQARTNIADLLAAWTARWPTPDHIPVVVFQDEDRYARVCQHLATLPVAPQLRLATWAGLAAGMTRAPWRDERGRPCEFQPLPESEAG